ncbi:MAG: inositol monophosphatase [Candidatus Cyclonatronum sp.]|uniref:inositol monophosphatase family protein n=1 Tax=Cyclonatronum sp. TaxID=3024185 RepID=UPI0025B9463B|nr:inositol monophosphatase family protein [Cyclonatronum sp.]MCC5933394.1 inositol monophosphatase [Balneolales bacterium]MCH8487494.1 inositol monophosphatase [Cyclonatronum sp.]
MPKTYSDLQVAHEAALKGAQIIRHFAENRHTLTIDHKGRHDLVTQADVQTEQRIIETIREYCPNDAFLAEESSADARLTDARTWIIDPIDGTTNFAHAFPVFCVSVALWENRQPKAAVIYEVNSGEMFTAEAGGGAFLNGKPIRVSEISRAGDALLGTGFPYRDLGLIDDYLRLMKCFMEETHGIRRPGSAAYDLACVAAGRLDGFYEYALSPWDVAAGVLLIQEAGGTVCDWDGGEGWLFGKRIICGNSPVSAYLLERIREYIPEEKRRAQL